MSYFDELINRLLPRGRNKKPLVVDFILTRSSAFSIDYRKWKESGKSTQLLDDIHIEYKRAKNQNEPTLVVLHQSSTSNGFAITYRDQCDSIIFSYLFDYLAEQVSQLGYARVMSKETFREKGQQVERKEMHYLKPKRGFVEPIDQKYGNLQIEYIEQNNQPIVIKFLANTYSDRKYSQPLSFDSLVANVLNLEVK